MSFILSFYFVKQSNALLKTQLSILPANFIELVFRNLKNNDLLKFKIKFKYENNFFYKMFKIKHPLKISIKKLCKNELKNMKLNPILQKN